MKEFGLNLHDGHAIIHDGENIILLDTGSPVTFHNQTTLLFLDKNYNVTTDAMGVNIPVLSDLVRYQITTLMGTDILGKYLIEFDYSRQKVTFRNADSDFEGTAIPIISLMNIPVVNLGINGQQLRFFLDSGARLSYLNEKYTFGSKSLGEEEDFYPGIGRYRVPCFLMETLAGNSPFLVKYGTPPDRVIQLLKACQVDGIIGYDFFARFRITLDISGNRIYFD